MIKHLVPFRCRCSYCMHMIPAFLELLRLRRHKKKIFVLRVAKNDWNPERHYSECYGDDERLFELDEALPI